MKLDKTTKILFGRMPREVANPNRWVNKPARTIKDLENFIDSNNGVRDCYTSVYPLDTVIDDVRYTLIDKIYFDVDYKLGITTLEQSFDEGKKLYRWAVDEGQYRVIPRITGKKGIALDILTKPKTYENQEAKKLLKSASYGILCAAFGHENGKIKAKCIDSVVIGDIRRITRFPNTLRPPENLTWCTYLPPDWDNMSTAELIEHSKKPHSYDYVHSPDSVLPYLELMNPPPDGILLPSDNIEIEEDERDSIEIKGHLLLQNVLRPCLYRHIMRHHPLHYVRAAVTADLLGFFSKEEVFKMYQELNWDEWDPEITKKMIESCTYLKPYSCTRLKQLGVPRECCID